MKADMYDASEHGSPVGYGTLLKTWAALVVLTLLLVGVSTRLGGAAAVVAMLLVTPTKASLVGYVFMDLKHESNAIKNMVLVALGVLLVFIALLFSDFLYR